VSVIVSSSSREDGVSQSESWKIHGATISTTPTMRSSGACRPLESSLATGVVLFPRGTRLPLGDRVLTQGLGFSGRGSRAVHGRRDRHRHEPLPRVLSALGVETPDGSDDLEHVEVKMSGLTFFLTTVEGNARWDPTRRDVSGDGYRIILEFYAETADAVDAKYAELTGWGYEGHCAPYDVTPKMRFAMVDDPDGNTILLSGMTTAGAAASGEDAAGS
jgi:hypothetical protein